MKHCPAFLLSAVCFGVFLGGCNGGSTTRPADSGPVKGTLGLDNLTPDQQIAKVQNDNTIPDQYKQTYINSIKAKAGAGAPK